MLRSGRACSTRARSSHRRDGRPHAVPLQARLPDRRSAGNRARLERVGRLRRRGRDVQQQRRVPQGHRRRDVPVVTASPATRQHVTRGRANTLRLALSGQLGPDALASDELAATMDLCVGCKGCRRECPTGVDMSRMKIEVSPTSATNGNGLDPPGSALFAYLPRYAPWASAVVVLPQSPRPAARARRLERDASSASTPKRRNCRAGGRSRSGADMTVGDGAMLARWCCFADTFSTWFEPEVAHAALSVLVAAGYRVHLPSAADGKRPLCCGRTFLSAGLIDEARARGAAHALRRWRRSSPKKARRSSGWSRHACMTLRDEYAVMSLGPDAGTVRPSLAVLFEEFLVAESDGRAARPHAQADRADQGADPRPLPPEGVRRRRRDGDGAPVDPEP